MCIHSSHSRVHSFWCFECALQARSNLFPSIDVIVLWKVVWIIKCHKQYSIWLMLHSNLMSKSCIPKYTAAKQARSDYLSIVQTFNFRELLDRCPKELSTVCVLFSGLFFWMGLTLLLMLFTVYIRTQSGACSEMIFCLAQRTKIHTRASNRLDAMHQRANLTIFH